jgi:3-hydroxybutyryl-CoA dehydrogenase
MTRFEQPRLAIIGAGEIGCGWAALAVGAGWPVAIYETDTQHLHRAVDEIARRAETLIGLGRADATVARENLGRLRTGRSLLNAVDDADWIIEALPEDLSLKQKLYDQVEPIARMAAILTSSTAGLRPSELCARVRRPERFLVAHPMRPVEYLPVVEVVPGANTDPACVEDVRFWLSLLGRVPIVFKKEISGNIVARIEAAVYRECIHLVLQGVLDVEDVDRAIALGPALAWAASGPQASEELAAGELGAIDIFIPTYVKECEERWGQLAQWQKLTPEEQKKLIRAVEKAYEGRLPELREVRDRRLARFILAATQEWPGV